MKVSTCKHTSGPWFINDNTADQYGQLTVESQTDGAVAICYTMDRHDTSVPAECVANARLIAAAPNLLAALQAVNEFWAGGDVPADIDAQIRAAITEATGVAA